MLKVTQLGSGRAGPQCWFNVTLPSLSSGYSTRESPEGPLNAGIMEGKSRCGSPRSVAARWEVAARAWEDPGEGEEPVAGVRAGASGHQARMAPAGR